MGAMAFLPSGQPHTSVRERVPSRRRESYPQGRSKFEFASPTGLHEIAKTWYAEFKPSVWPKPLRSARTRVALERR